MQPAQQVRVTLMFRRILEFLLVRGQKSSASIRRLNLSFPNASRSFASSQRCVRFSGYDSVKEISFFLELDALSKLTPNSIESEAEILRAFDDSRLRIEKVACIVYATSPPNRNFTYHLLPTDF